MSVLPPSGDLSDPDDPFLSADPAARERELRRREREERRAKRAERDAERTSVKQQRAVEREARDAERARHKAERDADREAERVRREAESRAERDALRVQRDSERVERVAAAMANPAPPVEPAPALLDEPAPQIEPWAHELAGDDDGGAGTAGGGEPPRSALGRAMRRPFLWIGLVVLALVAWFTIALFQPFAGAGGDAVAVKIPRGSTVGEIGDLLDQKGVISSSALFQIRATLAGRRNDLLAGSYRLPSESSYSDVLDALTTPAPQRTRTVTIPEGYTREQTAKLATKDGLAGSYAKASQSSSELSPADYGAKNADSLEGFLYPSTFELPPHATSEDLVAKQLAAFKQNFSKVDLSYAKSKNLTPYDVLIIASMVEEEAGVESDRPLVAEVIYNRLAEGGPLGIDATIRYVTGNYDQPLTESELAIDSPYNTRVVAGLPPGPIDNPGLSSIEAAAHPAEGDLHFYVTKPGACGELQFSRTLEEHNSAVANYNSAREAAGGKSPTNC